MVLVLDTSVHVHATTFARMSLDRGARVDDPQLVAVGGHAQIVTRNDGDLRKQRSARLPAFRTAADVVVGRLPLDRHGDLFLRTVAIKRPAGEVGGRRL